MRADWKDRECRECTFRVDGKCRRFPPTLKRPYEFKVGEVSSYDIDAEYDYPDVNHDKPACAEIVLK